MTRVIITGSKGRMGQAIVACATRMPELQVVGQIDQGDDINSAIDAGDVVVDFSFHNATAALAELCARKKKALVIGTTGHSDGDKKRIMAAVTQVPVVWASNFSTGVNTLF